MDGLREEADILFVLTTNRPESLEAVLASRPGRVDQAIEFPLPDAEGREKLVRLYAQGVAVSPAVVGQIVKRTDRVSQAFIKELMRRSVQFHLERDSSASIELTDVERARRNALQRRIAQPQAARSRKRGPQPLRHRLWLCGSAGRVTLDVPSVSEACAWE